MISNADEEKNTIGNVKIVPERCILIAGAGPVGLLLAVVLSSYGVKSILLERNQTTTKYVKEVRRTLQQ
jgi:2-polyprenyl-6-methoxyphenol hydroxylase-like FAD-dependent oxidoreductase